MAFATVVARRPVSGNKPPNPKFAAAIMAAAAAGMEGRPLQTGRLYARITWFHRDPTDQDVDNVPKHILDALKNVVYPDDVWIAQCLATRIDLQRTYTVSTASIDSVVYNDLTRLLANEENRHVLYIEIGEIEQAEDQVVVFGPIDGGRP